LLGPSVDVVVASAIGTAILSWRTESRRLGAGCLSAGVISGRTLHQGIISLADQAVASATNFATGIIIARVCSKKSWPLYARFQPDSLDDRFPDITDNHAYMVYARGSKAGHALYTGSTLIHQCSFCLITTFGVICAAFAVSQGLGRQAWAGLVSLSL